MSMMLNKKFLLLDCNYLAHRAKYVFGDLSYKGSVTGVVYGFLKEIITLTQRFQTEDLLFCWDSKESKRKEIYLPYKAKRHSKELTKEEKLFDNEFHRQIELLKYEYLHRIGYVNIFELEGFEADDIIAYFCKENSDKYPDDEIIIITADQDLYQCLRPNVSWYNPKTKKTITYKKFIKEYGITPKQWIKVKAIAGCSSDNVEGIRGVGEKTAIKFLKGELKKDSKVYNEISNNWKEIVLRNRKLVELPFEGITNMSIDLENNITQKGWNSVTKELGMRSMKYVY